MTVWRAAYKSAIETASIRSLLFPSLSNAFFRGLHTTSLSMRVSTSGQPDSLGKQRASHP